MFRVKGRGIHYDEFILGGSFQSEFVILVMPRFLDRRHYNTLVFLHDLDDFSEFVVRAPFCVVLKERSSPFVR